MDGSVEIEPSFGENTVDGSGSDDVALLVVTPVEGLSSNRGEIDDPDVSLPTTIWGPLCERVPFNYVYSAYRYAE